jgi:hypothetical protein
MKIMITAAASATLVASVFALPAVSSRREQTSIPARIRTLERNVRVLKAQLASTRATANSARATANSARDVADKLDACLGRTLIVYRSTRTGVVWASSGIHNWANPNDFGSYVPSSVTGSFNTTSLTFLTTDFGSPSYYVALVDPSCYNGFG